MKNLDIENDTLKLTSSTDGSFQTIDNLSWEYDAETSFLTIDLEPPIRFLANNVYSFYAKFKGYTTDDLLGFYRTSYKDNANQTKYLILKYVL